MVYFGYGSNLDEDDLARYGRERGRGPLLIVPRGTAFLPDRRLAFTHRSSTREGGVLDVPPERGSAVPGILFEVSLDEMETLDDKEGEGHVYTRFATVALTDDGAERPVFAFEVVPGEREPFVPPAPTYLEIVRRGYERHGLDTGPLNEAAAGRPAASPVAGLFVYGTLRRGEERFPVLARHAVDGGEPATISGTLLDLGSYPGLVLDGAAGVVSGELYFPRTADALLAELDPIERFRGFGHPGSIYRRAIVRVRRADAGSVLAWTYVYAGSRDGARVIASGDWLDRRAP